MDNLKLEVQTKLDPKVRSLHYIPFANIKSLEFLVKEATKENITMKIFFSGSGHLEMNLSELTNKGYVFSYFTQKRIFPKEGDPLGFLKS